MLWLRFEAYSWLEPESHTKQFESCVRSRYARYDGGGRLTFTGVGHERADSTLRRYPVSWGAQRDPR